MFDFDPYTASDHVENFATIGIDIGGFSALTFDEVMPLVTQLWHEQQKSVFPDLSGANTQAKSTALNNAYQAIESDSEQIEREWPIVSPKKHLIDSAIKNLLEVVEINDGIRINLAQYLMDLAVGCEGSLFSTEPKKVLLFDLKRAYKQGLGGRPFAEVAEESRCHIAENLLSSDLAMQEQIAGEINFLENIYGRFARNVIIRSGGIISSDNAQDRFLVGVLVTKSFDALFDEAGLSTDVTSIASSVSRTVNVHSLKPGEFTRIVKDVRVKVPNLDGKEAVLLVSFIPNNKGIEGVFAIEGQVLEIDIGGGHD